MQVKSLVVCSDSKLVVRQANDNFPTKDKGMAAYLKKVMDLLPYFEKFELIQISRAENIHVDTLSKLSSNKDSELLRIVPVEYFINPLHLKDMR